MRIEEGVVRHVVYVFDGGITAMRLMISGCIVLFLTVAAAYGDDSWTPVSFIALGDAGLHHSWYDKEDYGYTFEELLAKERQDWIDDQRPAEQFSLPPLRKIPGTDYVVEQSGQQATADAIATWCAGEACDFMIVLGDNIYPDGADGSDQDSQRLMDVLVTPYLNIQRDVPDFLYYAALGNHDWKSSRQGRDVQVSFGASARTRYRMESPGFYTYTRGNAQFWVLDTEMLLADSVVYKEKLDSDGRELATSELDPVPGWAKPQSRAEHEQLQWLAQSMAESSAHWKVVYGHHTLWSAGGTKFGEAHVLRPLLLPILCRHADAWFNGHEHDLGVFSDSCETTLGSGAPALPIIVSGAGAKQRAINYGFHEYQEATYSSYEAHWMKGMTWGFSHVVLNNDEATVSMITTPNDQSGKAEVEYVYAFPRRSGFTHQER